MLVANDRHGKARGTVRGIGHASSLVSLRAALASRLVDYGLDDLDGGDLRRRDAPSAPPGYAMFDSRASVIFAVVGVLVGLGPVIVVLVELG